MPLPAWVPGDEIKPAPLPLLLVQAFVNTWESDSGADLLVDPAPAVRWLASTGLAGGEEGIDDRDLATAREVRESIRALLVHNGGGPAPDPAELRPLRDLGQASRFDLTVTPDGHIDLQPAGNATLKLASLLVVIRDSQRDGTWARLKACHNCECRWAFYDRSHAGRGAWCDMSVCGNRLKNRALRSRKAGQERPGQR